MTDLQFSQGFTAAASQFAAVISRSAGTATGITQAAAPVGEVTLSYDAASGAYTLQTAGGDATSFTTADRLPNGSGGSSAAITLYEKEAGNRSDSLALFNPGSGNPALALTYVSYGAWQTILEGPDSLDVSQQMFVYGVRQSPTQPSTGSASYTTRVDGFWATGAGGFALTGSSSFTADFSAMTVATSLNLTGVPVVPGSSVSLGSFTGTGTIAQLGGGFSGTLTHQGTDQFGNSYSGAFNGAFFGPQGQEMGYSFRLNGAGGSAVGAVVGRGN